MATRNKDSLGPNFWGWQQCKHTQDCLAALDCCALLPVLICWLHALRMADLCEGCAPCLLAHRAQAELHKAALCIVGLMA